MEKLVGVALVAVTGALLCKKEAGGAALLLTLAAAVYAAFWGLERMRFVVAALSGLFDRVGLDSAYWKILMKIVGIAYVGEFGTALCRDAGCQALGEQIAIAAKFSILAVSLPVLLQLVEVMERFG